MTDQEFEQRIDLLTDQIQSLPEPFRSELIQIAEKTRARHTAIKQKFAELHASARRVGSSLSGDVQIVINSKLHEHYPRSTAMG